MIGTVRASTPKCLLQQPEQLENLASAALGNWIALQAKKLIPPIFELRQHDEKQAENLLTRQIEIIRNRLDCNVPRNLVDVVADTAIKALSHLCRKQCSITQKHVAGRMAETLFNNKLTYLRFFDSWFIISFFYKSYKLTALTRLTLTTDNEKESIIFLQGLQNLKYLSLNSLTLSDDLINNIINCVAENCPFIEELDLSNTVSDVNDNIIDILTQIRKLKVVQFSYHSTVSLIGIKRLLLACNDIEYIKHGGNQHVIADVLDLIASDEAHARNMFKLTTCNVGSLYQLQLVVRMCPYIQNITLDCYSGVNDLMPLTSLSNLRELTLIEHDFYSVTVKDVLKIIGSNLLHLELSQVEEIDLNALKYISQVCPYLQSLTLYRCDFITNRMCSMCAEVNVSRAFCGNCVIKLRIPPFKNLQRLTVWERTRQESKLIRIELLFFLFSSCLNVEYVTFSSNFLLPGAFMLSVLDKNPMSQLKLMEIGRGVLVTGPVIERLIQNCIIPPEHHENCRWGVVSAYRYDEDAESFVASHYGSSCMMMMSEGNVGILNALNDIHVDIDTFAIAKDATVTEDLYDEEPIICNVLTYVVGDEATRNFLI